MREERFFIVPVLEGKIEYGIRSEFQKIRDFGNSCMRPASDLSRINRARASSGDNGEEEPPVPIPNTEVKLFSAEDTWRETAWENRTLPVLEKSKL